MPSDLSPHSPGPCRGAIAARSRGTANRARPGSRVFLAWALAAVSAAATLPAADLETRLLQVEHRTDPRGLDEPQPRLTWRLQSGARGAEPVAYQVLVASSAVLLQEGLADRWDSGRVDGGDLGTLYQGPPLGTDELVWWTVRAWDAAEAEPGPWAPPASWSHGLTGEADWGGAQWISHSGARNNPRQDDSNWHPWLRRKFNLAAVPTRAVLTVASLGYHELTVNGVAADDRVLAPSVSNLQVRARYVTYDVTDLLQTGPNVLALWLGAGWGRFEAMNRPDSPLVRARLAMYDDRGERTLLVTDSSWKAALSGTRHLGAWAFFDFGGELFDERRHHDDWNSLSFNDSSWEAATVFQPQITLSAENLPPTRILQTLSPATITARSGGAYFIDFGKAFTGWIEIRLRGAAGSTVDLAFSDRENADQVFNQHARCILGSDGDAHFRHRFHYFSGRYVLVEGAGQAPQPSEVRGMVVGTDLTRTGAFSCSNPLLQSIYDTTQHTLDTLSLGGYLVDCHHRERMGYGGDAHATMETALASRDMAAFYHKWLEDWRDVQLADGDLPETAPFLSGAGGPAWGGILLTLPWECYLATGDDRYLERNWSAIGRWLQYFQSRVGGDGLVGQAGWGSRGDEQDDFHFLGDWNYPGHTNDLDHDLPERKFFNNCYYVYQLRLAAAAAQVLGRNDESQTYAQRAELMAARTHAAYYRREQAAYVDTRQTHLALPLLAGVTPPEEEPWVLDRLVQAIQDDQRGKVDTGIHGTYFLVKTLTERNRSDLVFEVTNHRQYPGWGFMLERDATTIWEEWNGTGSRMHSSYLSIGAWFPEGLGGVRLDPNAPGYRHFLLWPEPIGDLAWARTGLLAPAGEIRSDWTWTGPDLRLEVTVPPGCTATLALPARPETGITESSQPLAEVDGVTDLGWAEGRRFLGLASGSYDLLSPGLSPNLPGPIREPVPAPSAYDVSTFTGLSWRVTPDASEYQVYFGTTPELGESDWLGRTTDPSWALPRLDRDRTYYWRVDTANVHGLNRGETRSFHTTLRRELLQDSFEGPLRDYWTVGKGSWSTGSGALGQLENINQASVVLRQPDLAAWTDYTLFLTLYSEDDDTLGLYFLYQNSSNHYRLLFNQSDNRRTLERVKGGKTTQLRSERGSYVKYTRHRLELARSSAGLEIRMDDQLLFGGPVADFEIPSGGIGFYNDYNAGSFYDDVYVIKTADHFERRFAWVGPWQDFPYPYLRLAHNWFFVLPGTEDRALWLYHYSSGLWLYRSEAWGPWSWSPGRGFLFLLPDPTGLYLYDLAANRWEVHAD